jgi:1-acyl-sn-glycerol-3-phosphate acyltransferase
MIRLLWRLAALTALLLAGLLILFSIYRLLGQQHRRRIQQRWSQMLLGVCGLTLRATGQWPNNQQTASCLVVMNHVSWLDIFALNAVMPVTFVAKSEIRRWPVLGWLVSGTGTIFIERGNRHAVRRVNHEIRRRIQRAEPVAFFPEGTTSDGSDVLRFHTGLFAAALHEEDERTLDVPIFPVGIRYFHDDARSVIPAYTGDDTLVGSIIKILSHRGLSVELTGLSLISTVSSVVSGTSTVSDTGVGTGAAAADTITRDTMTRHDLAASVAQRVRALVRS